MREREKELGEKSHLLFAFAFPCFTQSFKKPSKAKKFQTKKRKRGKKECSRQERFLVSFPLGEGAGGVQAISWGGEGG